jgi:two-component sensor histidine kinase
MISGIAVGVVVMLVLLTLFLLRRLNRETMEVILADTAVRKTLQEKEGLIRELLHRTNNSLQVIRSLVQLELISDPSADGYGALARLDYRVGVLSLVQQELGEENDYTWISLCRYLETVWSETVRVHGIPDDWICSIDCPETRLVLDAATPLGLIVGELFSVSATAEVPHRRQSETVRIGVSVTETGPDSLTVVYTDDRELSVHGETVQLITSLATHQLAGSVSWSRVHHFACTVAFAPTVYRPRVET